jgi:hypothetical protein
MFDILLVYLFYEIDGVVYVKILIDCINSNKHRNIYLYR